MWFHLGFQNFIAKKYIKHDSCDIFVSDFMRIWHKSLSDNELLSISQTLNPLIEASVQKLKDLTFSFLEDIKVQKEIKEENNNIFLKLESNIMGVKFQFQISLNQGDGEMLYKELTKPLLRVLINTQTREKRLMKIIKDKDAEIKDYVQEFGIRPSYLSTKPFNKKEFNSQESATDVLWDFSTFLNGINANHLLEEIIFKTKEEEPIEDKAKKKCLVDKNDKKESVFKVKNLNQSSGSNSCLLLDNKTIKKRKKPNQGFTIKL